MSVIVSNEDGEVFLLCKGADKYVMFFSNASFFVFALSCTFFLLVVLNLESSILSDFFVSYFNFQHYL